MAEYSNGYVILQEKAPSHEAGHHPSSAAQHQQTRPRFFNAAAARRQRASYIYCRGPLKYLPQNIQAQVNSDGAHGGRAAGWPRVEHGERHGLLLGLRSMNRRRYEMDMSDGKVHHHGPDDAQQDL
jgi:hypothetical protein